MNQDDPLKIFDNTLFLNELFSHTNLAFVGDPDTIIALNKFCKSINKGRRRGLFQRYPIFINYKNKNSLRQFRNRLFGRPVIIIASLDHENVIFKEVQQYFNDNRKEQVIIRMVTDVYVNFNSRQQLIGSSRILPNIPLVKYAVACTPRSGSNYLCELLMLTEKAGYPREYLAGDTQRLGVKMQFSFLEYMHVLTSSAVTLNNVFGIKLISHYLASHLEQEAFGNYFNQFKFIYLFRKNKLEQAISLYLAKETNIWHLDREQNLDTYKAEIISLLEENKIDFNRIIQYQNFINEEEDWLKKFFADNGTVVYFLEYEELISNPENAIRAIMNFLGILLDSGFNVPQVKNVQLKSEITDQILNKMQSVSK
jgi:LPS sulfotransferase NodH